MKKLTLVLVFIFGLTSLITSHPHIRKNVSVSAEGIDFKLSYFTVPFNSEHLSTIKEGFVFHCGRATLDLSQNIKINEISLKPGLYMVRAKATSNNRWTLMLVPQKQPNSNPNLDEAVAMETHTFQEQPKSHHLNLDITSGHGKTDGHLILSVTYGSQRVEGILGLSSPEA